MSISLDEAVELTRTGDVWVFRGRSVPDRAIQLTTNSPVNHVGMAVVLDDMPPLMWHAELGRSLPDLWSGGHQRGVQLHDLRDAVCVWANRYGQRAWLRQLDPPADGEMERAVLRTVARLDGTPFPSTAQLAWRWARGRVPTLPRPGRLARLAGLPGRRGEPGQPLGAGEPAQSAGAGKPGQPPGAGTPAGTGEPGKSGQARERALETAYCAEVVAVTYEAMGLLPPGKRPNWYDPGRFWSGDDLGLASGARLGAEIEVRVPAR
ncbi:collagen-like protein [Micromonospora sp. NPDC005298]|uniref:collagen-like triple helix repeat-containing protein n=1 Tax=Micromonospora sp. NPDC005298 TaxID=3156873 RepID=UPI0033A855A4